MSTDWPCSFTVRPDRCDNNSYNTRIDTINSKELDSPTSLQHCTPTLSLDILAAPSNPCPLMFTISRPRSRVLVIIFFPLGHFQLFLVGILRWGRFWGDGDLTGGARLGLRQLSLPAKTRTLRSQQILNHNVVL